jgi:hypothetical protein
MEGDENRQFPIRSSDFASACLASVCDADSTIGYDKLCETKVWKLVSRNRRNEGTALSISLDDLVLQFHQPWQKSARFTSGGNQRLAG